MDDNVKDVRISQWLAILEEQARSGLSKADWCSQNGISRGKFFRWQRICRDYVLNQDAALEKKTDALPALVEIGFTDPVLPATWGTAQKPSAAEHTKASPISIEKSGFVVRLEDDIDEGCLFSVLRVLNHVD